MTTPNLVLKVPRVIQLLSCDRSPRHEVKFSRHNIYMRDGNRCQYCGRRFSTSDLSLDHVVPLSRGGPSNWENIVCACLPCNVKKGNRLPDEAGMKLRRAGRQAEGDAARPHVAAPDPPDLEELPRHGVLERRAEVGAENPTLPRSSQCTETCSDSLDARRRSRTRMPPKPFQEIYFISLSSALVAGVAAGLR